MTELVKNTTLQAQEITENTTQFKVSVPSDFVKFAGWNKGEQLKVSYVVGSGRVMLEKRDEDGDE